MEYEGSEAKAYYVKRMEQIIAKHCSTKDLKSGKNYRYPVHYKKNGQGWHSNGLADVSLKDVPSMHYKFASHKMEIGKALMEILDFLQEHIDNGDISASSFDSFEHYSEGEE